MSSIQASLLDLFRADNLSWIMASLILFVTSNIVAYSSRYLAGDRNRRSHIARVLLLGICVLCMAFADNLIVLLIGWMASNLLLVRLMVHKPEWDAARNSGIIAIRTFCIGFVCLAVGFWLLAENAGSLSISRIVTSSNPSTPRLIFGLLLVAIAAIAQSAAWPFQSWLISSLNSPTPVSALMHAGIINGGGFLIVRFAPLFATQPFLLQGVFVIGVITAILGSVWKLIQTDLKRMLACSTMGQMGFMLMQCGMGLFAPAVSHLCWHGLFKAYLFLNAGSVVREARTDLSNQLTIYRAFVAGLVGIIGALVFALTSGIPLALEDTSCLTIALAFMASTQIAIGLLNQPPSILRISGILLSSMVAASIYGLSVYWVEFALSPFAAVSPQPLNTIYVIGFSLIVLMWIAMVVNLPARLESREGWKLLYMASLNASQPHPTTITVIRTNYHS